MYDDERFPAYVSTHQRRKQAKAYVAAQKKRGNVLQPVLPIESLKIAHTFWGKAWCAFLASQADLASRLPRGRSYTRHGAVVDLRVEPRRVTAQVLGSTLYDVTVKVKPLETKRWQAIVTRCHGHIDSLIDLLQGTFSQAVLQTLTHEQGGVFPESGDLQFTCSCPDWASMCKHVAAVLYAIGARLDHEPAVLFTLRDVDHTQLLGQAVHAAAHLEGTGTLADTDLGALFGIDLALDEAAAQAPPKPMIKKRPAARKKKARRKT